MCFEDLRLNEPLLRAVRAEGYLTPTPIQLSAIPHVLAGRDVLGCAQTGTGKTAAFALPILQRLGESAVRHARVPEERAAPVNGRNGDRSPRHGGRNSRPQSSPRTIRPAAPIRALVLCPTRELAQQIRDSFETYGRHTSIRTAVLFGGVNQNPQVRAIQGGIDVLIATPGRLLDLMRQGFVNLTGVEILVLDEADRMLDMGFLPDIRKILAQIPRQRQSLLFSATMPQPIRVLADDILRNPAEIQVTPVSSAAVTVSHWVHHVEHTEKSALLVRLLARTPHARTLVFTRTKRGADRLTRHLVEAGIRAAAIHGNKSQGARTRALGEFRAAKMPVLVATDLAARGLDVDDIAQVINYDLTADPETYVHRIGRTGRAGASGTAVSFCTSQDRDDLRAIERLLRAPMQLAPDSVSARDHQPRKPHAPRSDSHRPSRPSRPAGSMPASNRPRGAPNADARDKQFSSRRRRRRGGSANSRGTRTAVRS